MTTPSARSIAAALATGLSLARGVAAGQWTLQALDKPPCGAQQARSVNVRPAAPYRNLAREWIAANPEQWRVLQERAYSDETLAKAPWLA